MKRLIIAAMTLLCLNSCVKNNDGIDFEVYDMYYDGHHYLYFENNGHVSVVHDPDCKCLNKDSHE